MNPYYEDEFVTLYLGDCLEVLPRIKGVGLVLTSPPYNIGGGSSANKIFANLAGGYDNHDDEMPYGEYVQWQQQFLRSCWATLTDDGAIFYNHKPRASGNRVTLPLDLLPSELPVRQVVIWDRGSGFNRNLTHFVPTHEWIVVLAKDAFRLVTRIVDDVWRIPFETRSDHPAPFPVALADRAIGSTSAELILDPFVGSGTTLVAAKQLGRKAIGIEKSERYCEMAAKRLAQGVMFSEAI